MVEPLDTATSIGVVTGWLSRPNVVVPGPTRRHFDILGELLAALGTAGNLVSDAHLAALAVEHGAELCSYDHDFARFPGLDWRLPDEP
jgi:predicted nucleic acid-binding protein